MTGVSVRVYVFVGGEVGGMGWVCKSNLLMLFFGKTHNWSIVSSTFRATAEYLKKICITRAKNEMNYGKPKGTTMFDDDVRTYGDDIKVYNVDVKK